MLYGEMAEFDIATNQTKYHNQLLQFFQNAETQRAGFEDELYVYWPPLVYYIF